MAGTRQILLIIKLFKIEQNWIKLLFNKLAFCQPQCDTVQTVKTRYFGGNIL
jgi:hypothetical protein